MNRNSGRCVLGYACRFPTHELNPEHKCLNCRQIIHVMCAVWDGGREGHRCPFDCCAKAEVRACPRCGRTDHKRSSSKKCPFYIGRERKQKNAVEVPAAPAPVAEVPVATAGNEKMPVAATMPIDGKEEEKELIDKLDMTATKFIYVGDTETENEAKKRYKPVVDVADERSFQKVETEFRLFGRNERNRTIEMQPTPKNLTMKYFSVKFMELVVTASNEY